MSQNSSPLSQHKPLFVFCGGGSGGHLYPAIAVCEELNDRLENRCRILFLSSGRSIEKKILSPKRFEKKVVASVTSDEFRKRPIKSANRLTRSILQARRIFKNTPPAVVVGLGGYGSLPGILAASSMRLPIVLLEQNSVAGKANELLSRFADTICISFKGCFQSKIAQDKSCLTGNPVRRSIREIERNSAAQPKTLTILGGSQGARAINLAIESIVKSNPEIFADWQILHQTGEAENTSYLQYYKKNRIVAEVTDFFSDMERVYRLSSLIISRAGATTLAELSVVGIPAILIPYPNSIRNHQFKNALSFADSHTAHVVEQNHDPDKFAAQVLLRLTSVLNENRQATQRSMNDKACIHMHAAEKVVDEILKLITN